jgi:ribosomal protein L7/L12
MPVFNDYQLSAHVDTLFARLQGAEAQLALLSEKAGVPYEHAAAQVPAEALELAQAGDRIGAIRRYRELTGADGKQAREVVSQL